MLVVISEPTLPAIPLLRISLEAFRPSPVVRLQTGLAGKNACLQTRPGDYIPLDSSDNFDRTEMLEDNDFVLAGKFWVLRIVNFDTLTFHDTLIPPRGPGIPADETPSYCLDCLLSLSEAIADEKEPAACATDLLTSNSLGQGGSWAPDCRAAVGAAGRSSDCGLYAWRQAPVNSIELSPPGQADNKQRIHVAPPFRCPSGADGADCSTGDKSHGAYTVVSDGRVLCCSSEVLPGRATRWLSANSSSFPESGVTLAGGPTLTPSPARISNGEQRMRWRKKSRKKSCLGAASGTLSCTKTNTVCPESPNSPRLSSQEPSGSATLPACRSADSTETGICARTPAGARSSFSAAPRSHASEANRVAGLEHQCGCPDGSSDHCSRTDCKNQAPSFRGRVITFYVAKTDYSNSQEHSSFLAATTHRLGLLRDQLQHDLEQTTTGPQIYSSHGEAVQVPRREADISTLLSSPGDCSEQERPQLEQSSLVQRRIRTLAFRWLAKTYEELLDAFFLCLLPALAARPPFLVPRLPAEPAASRQRRRRQLRQQDAPEALPYVSRTDGYRAQDFASTREGNVTAAARLREVSTSGSRDCSLRAPRLQNPNSPSSVPSTTCGEESPSLPSGTLLFLGGSRTRGHPRLVPSRGISADIRSDSPADRAARRSLRNLHTRVTWQPLPELQVNSPFYQSNWEAGREPDFAVVFKRAKAGAGRRPPSLLSICVASLNRMFPALIVSLFNYQQAMLNGRLLCSLLTWSRVCPPPQVILTFFMVASSCEPESFESLTSGHPLSPAEESRNRSEATAPGRPYADLQTKEGRIEGPVLTDGEAGGRQTNRTATGGEGDGGPGCLFDKTAYRMSAGSNFRQRYPFVDMLLHRVYLGEELFPSIPYLSAGVVEAIFCSRSLNRIDTQHHLISVILSWQFIQKAKGQLCRTFACFDPVIPHVIENATAHPLKSDGFLPCNDEQSLSSSPSCQRSVSSGVVLDVPQEECLVQSVEFCPAGCGPATHVLPAPTSPKRTAGESTVSLSPASLTLEKCTATSAGMVHARPRIHCRSIPATHPPQETTTASRESRIHSVTTCTKRCMRCRLCTVGSLCQQVLVNAAPWLRLASQNHMAAHSPWTALPHTSPQPSGAYWLQLHSLLRWHEREEAVEHRQLAGSRPSSDCNHRQDDYAVQLRAEADAEGGAGGGQAESRGEAEGGAAFEKFRQRRGWRLRRGPRYVAQSSGSTVGGSPCPYDPEEPLSAYFHPGEVLVWLHKRWRLVFIRRKRLPPKKTSRDSREPLPTSFDRPSSSRGDEVVDDLLTEHTVGGVSPLPDTGESAAQSRVPGIPRTPNRILAAPTAAPSPQIATRNTGGTFHNTERVVSKNVSLESVPGECLPEQSSPDHGSALARPEAVPFQGPASLAGHRTPTEVDGASREEAVERNQGEGAPYAASLNLDELSHISLTDLPDPSHLDFAACRSDVGRKKKPLRRRFVNKIMYASDRRWLEVLTNGPQYSRPEQQPHGGELYFRHARDAECVALHVAGRLSLFSLEELPRTHRALEGLVNHILYRTRLAAVFSNLGQQNCQATRQQAYPEPFVQCSAIRDRLRLAERPPARALSRATAGSRVPASCHMAVLPRQRHHEVPGLPQDEQATSLHTLGRALMTPGISSVQTRQLNARLPSPSCPGLNPKRPGHGQEPPPGFVLSGWSFERGCPTSSLAPYTPSTEKARVASVRRIPDYTSTRAGGTASQPLTSECESTLRSDSEAAESPPSAQTRQTDTETREHSPSTWNVPLMCLFDFSNQPDEYLAARATCRSSASCMVPMGPFRSDITADQLHARRQGGDPQQGRHPWRKVNLPSDDGPEGWMSEKASLGVLLRWKSSLIVSWQRQVFSHSCVQPGCELAGWPAGTGGGRVSGSDSREKGDATGDLAGPECPCGCMEASQLLRLHCSAAPPM